MSSKVLLVVTSTKTLGPNGPATGVWLEELAQAYFTLRDAGFDLLIASTLGGSAPIDRESCQEPWLSATGRQFMNDDAAMQLMATTVSLDEIDPASIRSIYLVGGAGTMFDFPRSEALGRVLSSLASRGLPVAAVCHGVAGLASASEQFVRGKKVTCFSNAEEAQVAYVPYLPVLPENLLRSLGANFSCTDPWIEYVVDDGMLFTGQNPASAAPLARLLAAKLRELEL